MRTVIGVAGGFVLVGNRKGCPVLAHYDFLDRRCTLHRLAQVESPVSWFYYPDLHAIAGLPGEAGQPCMAIDLAGDHVGDATASSRAARAAERARAGLSPYPLPAAQLSTSPSDPWADLSCRAVRLDAKTGILEYRQGSGQLKSLTPLSDGRPALKGARIACTRQGGDVLAIRLHGVPVTAVMFLSIARAAVVGMISDQEHPSSDSSFALSRDGRRFARRLNDQQVEVREVPGDRPPVLVSAQGRRLDPFRLAGPVVLAGPRVRPGRTEAPAFDVPDPMGPGTTRGGPPQPGPGLPGTRRSRRGIEEPAVAESGSSHDCVRFLQVVEHSGLRILLDQYNQLAVLGRDGELIGMFYVSGHEFAAWMPDGTRLGSSRLIGPEPTPGAAERMAAVLRSAERGGGGSS